MGTRDKRGIGHVHDVHHCAYDMMQPGTCLGQGVSDQYQGSVSLGVGITFKVGGASGSAGDENLVANPDSA